jgi:hypothetical protein
MSQHGPGVTVSNGAYFPFARLDQGNGWNGDFSTGDQLLEASQPVPFILTFSHDVYGVATQFDYSKSGQIAPQYAGAITALDDGGSPIPGDEFTFTGTILGFGDGSAIVIGLMSTVATIHAVFIDGGLLPWGTQSSSAIDRVDIRTISIPEPSSLVSMLIGTIGASLTVWVGSRSRR